MKKIFYNNLNLGANRCGIEFGYKEFISKYPKYINEIEFIDTIISQTDNFFNPKLKFKGSIVDTLEIVAKKIDKSIKSNFIPILLGGDHSLAISSISAVSNNIKEDLGVIWVDAHGDMNTDKTSDTGHIHGMSLASMVGYGDKDLKNVLHSNKKLLPKNCIVFGTRDLDVEEEKFMQEVGMKYYSMEEIRRVGFYKALEQANNYLKTNTNKIHISFDLDSICPKELTGVSTPVEGGFSKKEGIEILKYISDNNNITSIDIVEYNPLYEKDDNTSSYMNELLNNINTFI